MISFNKAVSFLILSAATIQSASATCHSWYYQKGSSNTTYVGYSYDHDDGLCASRHDRLKLSTNSWQAIYADKDHQSTIQVEWRYVYENLLGYTVDKYVDFELCDGITQASKCSGQNAYKSTCSKYYVFYPEEASSSDYPQVCVAKTDSDGNLLYDDDGEPYGDCSGCSLQDHGRKLDSGLRGSSGNGQNA